MDELYAFTDDDLWAFLATKRDDEVIGYCGDPSACLIAWAVRAKYSDLRPDGVEVFALSPSGDGRAGIMLYEPMEWLPLTPMLWNVLFAFDQWTQVAGGAPVTKAEFMQAWQAYCRQF